MPVANITTASHNSLRRSKPCSNRSKVQGPGEIKNTKIQIGQCATRYSGLLRSRSFRSLASSNLVAGFTSTILAQRVTTAYCLGVAGLAGGGAPIPDSSAPRRITQRGRALIVQLDDLFRNVDAGRGMNTGLCGLLTSTTST